MRSTFKTVLVAMLAVLALSAVAASAAQAAEAPFFKIAGTRLTEGQSKEVTAKAGEKVHLEIGGLRITCTSMTLASGAKLLGSNAGSSGRVEAALELSCSGEHAGCEKIEPIKTQPLLAKLVTLGEKGKGKLGLLLAPKEGTEFMRVHKAEGCVYGNESRVSGEVVAELYSGEKPVEVGTEPAEAKTLKLVLPTEQIKRYWWVHEGAGAEYIVKELSAGGGPVSMEGGSSTLELAGGPLWGVFD